MHLCVPIHLTMTDFNYSQNISQFSFYLCYCQCAC
uniref:Uncharacterized protein n=1 Tax=Anguilla anguilla TaxID=7936 RepID=A0A0E9TVV4_ANGAN